MVKLPLALLLVVGCGAEPPSPLPPESPAEQSLLIRNARLPGGESVSILLSEQGVLEMGTALSGGAAEVIDAEGRFAVPALIDSHVHLRFLPVADTLVGAGIAAAVDLASPLPLQAPPKGLDLVHSGPMLTAVAGYPTRSWGHNGYGLEVENQADIAQALDALQSAGGTLVKFSIGAGPDLSVTLQSQLIEAAHARGLKVAVHTLDEAGAQQAAALGADLLAHTPIEPLSDQTLKSWRGKAVVSTLHAFGNRASTAENLRRLHEAGATLLYGTDLGNTRKAGINCDELLAMRAAGLEHAEILAAATESPARYFGFTGLGRLQVGAKARLLLLDQDPSVASETLCRPHRVINRG